jgi:hypothetical protein
MDTCGSSVVGTSIDKPAFGQLIRSQLGLVGGQAAHFLDEPLQEPRAGVPARVARHDEDVDFYETAAQARESAPVLGGALGRRRHAGPKRQRQRSEPRRGRRRDPGM